MRRLRHSLKRLEEIEAIDRARKLSEEEGIWIRIVMTDHEVNRAAQRIAEAKMDHGEESDEFLAAVEEANPIFEQGMERYKQKLAKEEARR